MRKGSDAVTELRLRLLDDCAVAVTFFGELEECTVGELDNDRYGIVVRSRERAPRMGGALPRMPGIANEWQQYVHAPTEARNGRIGWDRCCHECCHADGRRQGYDQPVTSAEIIEEIGVRLARVAPADSRVVLFGSHARGEADDGSDYDILVIEPDVADAARESVRLRTELGDLLVPIDVVVIDRARARRRASVRGTMVERALREGRVLADT